MYPDGVGEIKFDDVIISFKPGPAEINELYYLKAVDTDSEKNKKPYEIKYGSER